MSEAAGFGMVGGPFFFVATPVSPSSSLLLLLELLLLLLPLLPLDLVFPGLDLTTAPTMLLLLLRWSTVEL